MGRAFLDVSEMEDLRDQLEQADTTEFMERAIKRLADRLITLAKRRTPVGKYPKATGKKGGTLRRGWPNANQLHVTRTGSYVSVVVSNKVYYAPYVEYGHRTRGGKSWVSGQFMLTKSVEDIDRIGPRVLMQELEKWLEEVFK